mgnify:CR=1 FL=1
MGDEVNVVGGRTGRDAAQSGVIGEVRIGALFGAGIVIRGSVGLDVGSNCYGASGQAKGCSL